MSLTNSQYAEIQRDYDRKQSIAIHRVLEHTDELYKKEPEIKNIDSSIASLSIKAAQRLLSGDAAALTELKSGIKDLSSKKDSLITSLGYDLDYIEPVYKCNDCKDTGYINGRKCHCFTQAALNLVYRQSNLSRALVNENFNTFDIYRFADDTEDPSVGKSPRANMLSILSKCHNFVDSFDKEYHNLLFFGETGVGKTFMTNCIAKDLLDSGHSVIYFTAFQLFDLFKDYAYQRSDESQGAYQNLFNADLLIIDDLGTEVSNSYTVSQLFMLINERILRQKPVIISTNLGISDLNERYSERILSRIMKNYDIMKFVGNDLRVVQ